MKILVTGAGGFIGGATMELGRERGHQMTGCDVTPRDREGVVEGSVTDLDLLTRLSVGCGAIIHTATVHTTHLKRGMSHGEFYAINVAGADNVFQAALANRIPRVVFSSSLDIHCGTNADWAASGIVRYMPDTPDVPNALYPLTKLMVEEMGHYYHRAHGIQFCALRYVYIHGSKDAPLKLIPYSLISRVTVVEDCAEANLLACESDRVVDEVLLVGPDNPLTNVDLAAAAVDPEPIVEKYWPGSTHHFRDAGFPVGGELWPVCDVTRTWQLLGWKPRHDYAWLWSLVKGGLRK